jgi:dipeptidyl aminopeptidase/acylaminoacyl peptidase
MHRQLAPPRLLLIHGDADRNVPFQQTTDLVEKLRVSLCRRFG